ncbi:hypothetical protein HYG77_34175 (plasmid) [Rhodococcus sp. ZPP]|uniref:hypothetical protein n=1 Tax=Rhodococcus sp. ZPP TaxID=2749906 RepID=UPI001AD8638D|nr:hypothetical protein [Rhodococcus sp. ZPP]QTJ70557.1 hypothetical protein HYG77_34175 [Rhodococcus sp. ZPP]
MIVTVTSDAVELSDADNLKQLHLSCASTLPLTTIDAVLRRTDMGHIDHDHVYLNIDGLRRRRECHGFVDEAAFNRMVEYATSKQWISADGSAVRAHIVRTETL